MKKIIFTILAIGVLVFFYFTNPSKNNDWLYGKWEIKEQKKESNIHNFIFKKDGTMTFGNTKGVIYNNCTYSFFTRNTIDFECIIKGKKAMFPLKLSMDNSIITMTTGNTFIKK